MKEIAAEGVDRADARELERLEGAIEKCPLFRPRGRADRFDLATQLELRFAGRFFGKGHRDDAVEGRNPGADETDDPPHESCRLARSGRRLDKEGRAEIARMRRRASASASSVTARLAAPAAARQAASVSVRRGALHAGRNRRESRRTTHAPLSGYAGRNDLRERIADRLGDLNGRRPRVIVERDFERSEAAPRRAEIETTAGYLGLAGEQLFGGERIEQRLQGRATGDQLARVCRRTFPSCDRSPALGRMGGPRPGRSTPRS